MKTPRVLFWLAAAFALMAGCEGVPRPSGYNLATAALPNDKPINGNLNPGGAGDTVVVVQCIGRSQVESVKSGIKTYVWESDTFQIILVEKGSWPYQSLSFLASRPPVVDGRSGPVVSPWPYNMGAFFRFWLDTRSTPARIVGQEPLVVVP